MKQIIKLSMKNKIFYFGLLLLSFNMHAQFGMGIPKTILKKGKFALLAGYNFNKAHWGEIGLVRGWRCNYEVPCEDMIAGPALYYYAALSTEFTLQDQKLFACPKLGYHIEIFVFGFGLNVLDYTDLNNHVIGLRPEIDLSLSSAIGIYYSYNILKKQDWLGVSNHNLGIKIILGTGLYSPVYLKRQKAVLNQK